ncbi:porphobilinogen deaminase, dipyromethane cofactor binding domain-containing protein [Lasiosphaeria ovina]|uniref:Porphobilinogen deaminase n=1 Tax=Lasiosphaeria ovina TaxID=92902 RepID=A0AAE0N8G1_9PEZI|nr:porphobilinogen deaminase, dipyromethane cofactor binding domain-containing protein [Lasiosphaeria ovina]
MAPAQFTIKVGTRRSALALKQVELVTAELKQAHPHVDFTVHPISVQGDRDKTTPLPDLGKGLWTSELEAQLESGGVDMVVHCLKDMPTTLPAGCALGCITRREDPRDVVIFRRPDAHTRLADLPAGAVVGTSSVRRAAQLRRAYPRLAFRDVRGNIDTRIRKLDDPDGPFDCIILAAAGLLRMDFGTRIAQFLDSATDGGGMLHAVGQGALCLEVRDGDERTLALLKSIEHTPTMMACYAERSLMRTLEGGCSVPIGVETAWVGGEDEAEEEDQPPKKTLLRIRAIVVSVDGKDAVESERTEEVASLAQADSLGKKIAQDLVEKGAQKILDVINQVRDTSSLAAVKVGDV